MNASSARGRVVGVLLLGLVLVPRPAGLSAAAVPLRQVDWEAVLAADPGVGVDPSIERSVPMAVGPFVLPWPDDETLPGGYAAYPDALYVDLDGDGGEEAVISIESGGTAGTVGFLVFQAAEPRPRLVAATPGYKLWLSADDGVLRVSDTHYFGFEPNCCPTARIETTYMVDGGRLTALREVVYPNAVQELTVEAFYRALGNRGFEDAYDFLSPRFRAANPFDAWVAGYATTTRVAAETEPGRTENEVAVKITAVDRTPSGTLETRRFAGTWTLVWNAEAIRWQLDRADIALAP